MTREEAIRELKIFNGTTRIRLPANFWEALNMAIKALEQEPTWIPVSERLPIEGGCYICTCYNGAIKTVAFFKWQNRLKQWEKTGTRAYWKIIAWMPLPPSYQGEK